MCLSIITFHIAGCNKYLLRLNLCSMYLSFLSVNVSYHLLNVVPIIMKNINYLTNTKECNSKWKHYISSITLSCIFSSRKFIGNVCFTIIYFVSFWCVSPSGTIHHYPRFSPLSTYSTSSIYTFLTLNSWFLMFMINVHVHGKSIKALRMNWMCKLKF